MEVESFALREITVRFKDFTALHEVSLRAEPHEVVGVIGPNGAGKSTLLNVAAGLQKPDSGVISIAGRDRRRLKHKDLPKLGIAHTPQVLGNLPENTVLECVMTGTDRRPISPVHNGRLGPGPSARTERETLEFSSILLRELGLAKYAGKAPDSLPQAPRKKLVLARALVGHPRLLLLDELADGLSGVEAAELAGLVRGLAKRMTVILVEHHLDLVYNACDRILVLDAGRLVAEGTPAEIRRDPVVKDVYHGSP